MTKLLIENPKTFKKKSIDINEEQASVIISELHDEVLTDEAIHSTLNNLDIPAELKVILSQIKSFTISVGNTIVKIGRRILELLIYMIKENPKAAQGLIIGSLLGFIFSTIPVIGWALGWLIQPLAAILGLSLGYIQDIKDETLKRNIKSAVNDAFDSVINIKT